MPLFVVFMVASSLPHDRVVLRIPAPLFERAKVKAKLLDDLFRSLTNDSNHVFDIKLESEIDALELKLLRKE